MAILLAYMFLLVFAIPTTIYRAYVFLCLWDWFVVPVFDLPHFNVWYAVGIMSLVSLFHITKYEHKDEPDHEQDLKNGFGQLLLSALTVSIVWGFAFVVHLIAG
jgi:hypothetical protein